MMKQEEKDKGMDCKEKRSPKKPYASPRLVAHGTINKMTGAVPGEDTDGLGGSLLG